MMLVTSLTLEAVNLTVPVDAPAVKNLSSVQIAYSVVASVIV